MSEKSTNRLSVSSGNNKVSLNENQDKVLSRIKNCDVSGLSLRGTFKDSLMSYKHDRDCFTLFVKACVKELSDSLDFFSVKSKAGSDMLFKFVLLSIEKYVDLTYEDFALFGKSIMLGGIRSRSGYYGYPKVYDRLDGGVLMEMLGIYYNAKVDEREAMILENHKRRNAATESALMGVSDKLDKEWSFQRIIDNMLSEKVERLVDRTKRYNIDFDSLREE